MPEHHTPMPLRADGHIIRVADGSYLASVVDRDRTRMFVRCVNERDGLVAELRATRDELEGEHHGIGLGGYCPLCARHTHITELLAKLEADDE